MTTTFSNLMGSIAFWRGLSLLLTLAVALLIGLLLGPDESRFPSSISYNFLVSLAGAMG